MKKMLMIGCVLIAGVVSAQTAGTDSARILSKLQSMSHGTYPASEWDAVIGDIHGVIETAEADGDTATMVEVTTILGEVYSGMLGQHEKGLAVLNDLKAELSGKPVKSMPRLYVKLAEVHGRLGNEAAIESLIEEFKGSSYYDPDSYSVSGLKATEEAVVIQRPNPGGDSSLTVSTMTKFLRAAKVAPGKRFPAFAGTDLNGQEVRLPMASAKVVLVDFWLPGWTQWERELPLQKQALEQFGDQGFVVIGMPVTGNAQEVSRLAAEKGLSWPQVTGTRSLAASCGLAGDAANFLIDNSGTILARDVHGSELIAAVRAAVGE